MNKGDLANEVAKIVETKKEARSAVDCIFNTITKALKKTFPNPQGEFLPFRLIVAGGDDLCIVMDESYILDFAGNISAALHQQLDSLSSENSDHPLLEKNLRAAMDKMTAENPKLAMRRQRTSWLVQWPGRVSCNRKRSSPFRSPRRPW